MYSQKKLVSKIMLIHIFLVLYPQETLYFVSDCVCSESTADLILLYVLFSSRLFNIMEKEH